MKALYYIALLAFCCSLSHAYSPSKTSTKSFTIQSVGNKYTLNSKTISNSAVLKILHLVDRAPVKTWRFPTSKSKWLERNADKAISDVVYQTYPGQSALFKDKFTNFHQNSHHAARYIPDLYSSLRTDFYLDLTIHTANNETIKISSKNAYPVLFPLQIRSKGNIRYTCCIDLIDAILKILGKNSLFDKSNELALRRYIAHTIVKVEERSEWNKIAFRHKMGPNVRSITALFNISDVNFNDVPNSNLFGPVILKLTPKEEIGDYLGYPQNLFFNVEFTGWGTNLSHIDSVSKGLYTFLGRIRYNKPFSDLIRASKEYSFTYSYDHSGDLRHDVLATITDDLKSIGKISLLPRLKNCELLKVRKLRQNETEYSRWLLDPNDRLVLWCFHGSSPLNIPEKAIKYRVINGKKIAFQTIPWSTLLAHASSKKSWFGLDRLW